MRNMMMMINLMSVCLLQLSSEVGLRLHKARFNLDVGQYELSPLACRPPYLISHGLKTVWDTFFSEPS